MSATSRSGTRIKQVSGARVLVVDDDPDHAAIVTRWLESCELYVQAAHDPDTALAQARALDPHVAIVDLHLGVRGERNGHALAAKLLAQSRRPLQVIVLTGDDAPEALERSRELGLAAHLVKPVRLQELARLVARLVGQARRPGSVTEIPSVDRRRR